MPPWGYHTPSASSVYCSIEKVAMASNGLMPMYMSWKEKAFFSRSLRKNASQTAVVVVESMQPQEERQGGRR